MVECPECGTKNSSSNKRCKNCGTELKSDSKKLLIGILIAVVVIAIVGVLASGMLSGDTTSDVAVVNDTDSNDTPVKNTSTNDDSKKDTSDSKDDSSSSGTVYWASVKASKFHKPSCEWAQKIKESNKIVYTSREDAIADGREPCGECNP